MSFDEQCQVAPSRTNKAITFSSCARARLAVRFVGAASGSFVRAFHALNALLLFCLATFLAQREGTPRAGPLWL